MDNEFDETGDSTEDLSPEELREQLAAERAARAAEREVNERNERRLDEMLRASPREPQRQAPAPLGPPPNAIEDPEGFRQWIIEDRARQQRELDARLARERDEVTNTVAAQSRVQLLWERFRTKYPTYAARTRLVEVAYGELVARGALPADNERAVDAVKREMEAMAGIPDETAANRTDDPSRGARPVRPRKRGAPEEDRPKSMTDAIYEQQVRAGLR